MTDDQKNSDDFARSPEQNKNIYSLLDMKTEGQFITRANALPNYSYNHPFNTRAIASNGTLPHSEDEPAPVAIELLAPLVKAAGKLSLTNVGPQLKSMI